MRVNRACTILAAAVLLATPHFSTDSLPVDARKAFTEMDPWRCMHLAIGVIALVIAFKSSSGLAGAYGIAVTGTMVVDTSLLFVVAWRRWHWPLWASLLFAGAFLIGERFMSSADPGAALGDVLKGARA